MGRLEQIEQQIRELSASEFARLRDWMLEQDWKAWDAQIETDARTGALDKIVSEAQSDFRGQRAREL
jgi:hypothetical protein